MRAQPAQEEVEGDPFVVTGPARQRRCGCSLQSESLRRFAKRREVGVSSEGMSRVVKPSWKADVIDVIEKVLRTTKMSWAAGGCVKVVQCGLKNGVREFGWWRCATTDEQICEVQVSKVPSCRRSLLVSEWLVC